MPYFYKIAISISLMTSIPAYNLGTPIDYIKCLIFDECKHQEKDV